VKKLAVLRFVHLALIFILVAAMVGPLVLVPQNAAAQPGFNFSPKSGPPGTNVTVTVSEAPSGEKLTVEGNGKALCSFKTNNNGKGECTFIVPKGSGSISLELTGPKVGHSDIGTFNITQSNNGQKGGNNRKNNSPAFRDALWCGLSLVKAGTKGLGGVPEGLLNSAVGCRKVIPGTPPLSPGEERTIRRVGCASSAVKLGLGIAALTGVETVGVGALLGLGIGTTQLTICGITEAEEAAKEYLREHGLDPDNITPVEDLGPLPSGPSSLPTSVVPNAGFTAQPAVQNIQTVEEIRTTVEQQVSAPSVDSIQEQQTEIRADVCASLPAGAGGCP
jgi:hypothetical protein